MKVVHRSSRCFMIKIAVANKKVEWKYSWNILEDSQHRIRGLGISRNNELLIFINFRAPKFILIFKANIKRRSSENKHKMNMRHVHKSSICCFSSSFFVCALDGFTHSWQVLSCVSKRSSNLLKICHSWKWMAIFIFRQISPHVIFKMFLQWWQIVNV